MSDIFEDVEPMVLRSGINVPYSWWAGETASRFLAGLRDEKKIFGTKCGQCERVYVPPRKNCPHCFSENREWVETSNEGALVSFTVARRQLAAIPGKTPVIFGLIKPDGADTALLHFLDEVDPGDVKIGMRLKPKFEKERNGTIRDIAYFKPAEGED